MLVYDKHIPLRLIICNKIQTITFQAIFNMLRLPMRSCFHLFVTCQVTRPLPPGAQCSVDTWRSEDRNNPGNSGNAKAEYNVLLTAQLFPTKKGKGGENYRPQNIFRCRVGWEERRLSRDPVGGKFRQVTWP